MDVSTLLPGLKVDLGIRTDAYNDRLTAYLTFAVRAIHEEGINLQDGDPQDAQLVQMYAGWLWRRRDTGEGMPRMIRYALNNRLFREKMTDA